jgi:hypothetical protein
VPLLASASASATVGSSKAAAESVSSSVKLGDCEMLCGASTSELTGAGIMGSPAKHVGRSAAACALRLPNAECVTRLDGEKVLQVEVGAGRHDFYVGL